MLRFAAIPLLAALAFGEASAKEPPTIRTQAVRGAAVDKDAVFKNWGVGGMTCGEFVVAREFPDSPVGPYDATFRQWLLGFATAFNIKDPDTADLLGGETAESAMIWIETYCRINPQQEFFQAVWKYTEQAYPYRIRQSLTVN